VHDAAVWRENGLVMFHYDAFYFGGNQHIDKALAVSRDGRHYYRIKRGRINMAHGACGEWDSGRDRTSIPLQVGDELWLYFCGMPAGCYADPDRDDATNVNAAPPSPDENAKHWLQRPWRVGLARLRRDGWGYVQLEREAERGQLTTIPFRYDGGQLVVNGVGLGEGGIRVEVRTENGLQVVEGFDAGKCSFDKPDSVSARVAWDSKRDLKPGTYRLRFVFEGVRSRLYAFGFE
jgi:hypothetical protein